MVATPGDSLYAGFTLAWRHEWQTCGTWSKLSLTTDSNSLRRQTSIPHLAAVAAFDAITELLVALVNELRPRS